jgi:transposase InsO family protein
MGRRRKAGRIRRPRGPNSKPRPSKRAQRRNSSPARRPPTFTDLSLVPADLIQRATSDKLPWIQRYVREGRPRGKVEEYAAAAKEALDLDGEVPPYATLMTWTYRYERFGVLGLIDSVASHAGSSYALTDDAKSLIRVAIIGGKQSITAARGFLIRYLGSAPSYNTVLREVHRLRRFEAHLYAMSRYGRGYFKNVFRLAIAQGALPAGYRYEIDSTVADIWVRVPDPARPGGWLAVRPVLTVVQDSGSRAFLAFNLSLSAVDSGIVLGTLQRAIDPAFNYPGMISLGVPWEVAVDKGAEHRGQFLTVMGRLGVEVINGIPDEPQGRAKAERIIGTIRTELFSHMIGYSPVHKKLDPYAPADADAKRTITRLKYEKPRLEVLVEQLLTLPALEAKVLAWGGLYNDRPHTGLPSDSPDLRRLIEFADRSDRAAEDNDTQEAA